MRFPDKGKSQIAMGDRDGDDASTRVQGRRAEERLSARRNGRLGGCRKDACCQAYFILEALAFFGALFLSCALCAVPSAGYAREKKAR